LKPRSGNRPRLEVAKRTVGAAEQAVAPAVSIASLLIDNLPHVGVVFGR
jgi:hypothetical protein